MYTKLGTSIWNCLVSFWGHENILRRKWWDEGMPANSHQEKEKIKTRGHRKIQLISLLVLIVLKNKEIWCILETIQGRSIVWQNSTLLTVSKGWYRYSQNLIFTFPSFSSEITDRVFSKILTFRVWLIFGIDPLLLLTEFNTGRSRHLFHYHYYYLLEFFTSALADGFSQ